MAETWHRDAYRNSVPTPAQPSPHTAASPISPTAGTRRRLEPRRQSRFTEEMMTELKGRGTNLLANTDLAVTDPELRTNKFVFLHTDMGHNEVLEKRQTFGKFLKTSLLEDSKQD